MARAQPNSQGAKRSQNRASKPDAKAPRSHAHASREGEDAVPTQKFADSNCSAGHEMSNEELLADDLFPDDMPTVGGAIALNTDHQGLHAKVLVLNRGYAAMRIVSAKRAFCLLARNIAEVIHVDTNSAESGGSVAGAYVNYDFESWLELSQLQRQFEADRHDWIKTVRMDIAVPRIIRLLGYDKLPEQNVKLNRRNLFARDRNKCQYCGRIFATSDLSIDHVNPRAYGGGDTWENLVCACIKCNARKGGRTPEQAGMKLIHRPVKPKRNPLIALRLGSEKYQSWKAFLDNAYWSVELG